MSRACEETSSEQSHTYVIDYEYHVVYLDKLARHRFPGAKLGSLCFETFRNTTEPCEDCPWNPRTHETASRTLIYSARAEQWFEITCLELDWFNQGPCVLFSGRPIDDHSRGLFATLSNPSSYDELFELNLTDASYKVLYHEPNKFAIPALEGTLSDLLDEVLNHMIHVDDRERFSTFWDLDTILTRIEQSGGVLRGEFRKLTIQGAWAWVSHTVVPVKRGSCGETVVMCFIANIETEVQARKANQDNAQIKRLRERDQLTGLFNSATFFSKASKLLQENPGRQYEVMYFDIEHFKLFNEWHGREAGDVILRSVATHLARAAQQVEGIAGYLGGDDFAFVLPQGLITEKSVESQLRLPPFDTEDTIGFQPAIGVCFIDQTRGSINVACDHAMTAMTSVKGTYNKRVAWYQAAMTEELENETKILLDMKQALQERQFVLYWQPQCSTRTGRIVGLEALVRWQHPERGLVMPGAFIPLLERNGFIASLDLYVWEEACRHLSAWIARGHRPIPISVNISRADLYAIDVVETFEDLVARYQLDRSLLELEITESAYAEDEKMAETVSRLKELGFTILMDDFGSGYSSLNMLKDITVDILKIDMGFLDRDNTSKRSESILEAVVSMARFMDLRIIAEGTETKEQVDFLRGIGCDYAQGYYFYRPMDTESLEKLLLQENVVDYRGVLTPTMETIDMDALMRDEEVNRTIISSLIGGMAVYAAYPDHFELLQVNNEYYRVTGCNAVDLRERQKVIYKQIHPDDFSLVMDLFAQAEQHPIMGAEGTFRRYRLSGELAWLHMQVFFLRHESGRSIFFASLSDVTDQQIQEEELRISQIALDGVLGLPFSQKSIDDMTSENRQIAAEIFLQNVPGGLIGGYCEDNFPVLFANEEIARMAGFDTSAELLEAIDNEIGNSIHPDDLPHVVEDIGPEYREGLEYVTQYRMLRKDGSWFWVVDHGRIVRTKNGRLAIASVVLDVDDTVRMQQALALEDDVLHRIIRRANLNVWIYDVTNDQITFQNLSATGLATLLASTAADDTPDAADAVTHDATRVLKRLAREVYWGRPASRDIEVWSDEEDAPVKLHVRCETVADANGDAARIIGYLQEVTPEYLDNCATITGKDSLLEMLRGKAIDHWCINLNTKRFLSSEDRRIWRKQAGLAFEDWSGFLPSERIGSVIHVKKDTAKLTAFLNFDSMRTRYDEGIRYDSTEFRQEEDGCERWMELSYHLIRLIEGGSVYAYMFVTDIDARKRRELELEDKAAHDALTGLMNRQTASTLLPAAITETIRTKSLGAFIIVDLDDFKNVNDNYGHLAGDETLSGIGRHLQQAFRKGDLVCRWGGDEFIVYCDDITPSSLTRRVRALCKEPWTAHVDIDTTIELSISAGIALIPQQCDNFLEAYRMADEALYRAKSQGKASFCFYE